VRFCAFLGKRQDGSAPIFFQGLGENLLITTCIEKQCIRPLNQMER